jgi:hypothetical protein
LGTWAKVANEFGFELRGLIASGIVKGAFPGPLDQVTDEQLRADLAELGSYRRVAAKYNTNHGTVGLRFRSLNAVNSDH